MKKIIEVTEGFCGGELFNAINKTDKSIKDCDGQNVLVVKYALLNDEDRSQTVLVFMDDDHVSYATNSKTFIADFMGAIDYGVELPMSIVIYSGKSRAGRVFYQMRLAD